MAQQNNQSPSLPLWKRLNGERTQGEWICKGKNIANQDERITFFIGGNGLTSEDDILNAQYATLAVNHLASLAEALEWLMDECQFIPKEVFTEQGKVNFQLSLIKAKEALNKIS